MNILQAINSDKAFKPLFKDLQTWESWIVFLKALFGLTLEKKDMKLFQECTGLKDSPEKVAREAYVVCGRRSGKSMIMSLISCYLALFRDWSKFLSAGERPYIFIIATNKAQGKIIKNYISGILHLNPHFRSMIKRELSEAVELKNGITIAIKPCSFRSLRGYTILCAIMEELSFWRWETESANPDKEILTALKPALSTIPESLLIGISTPYSRQGVLFEKFYRYFGKPGDPLIWKADTKLMNPTIDEELIKKAYEDDPESASAEWGASFRSDISAFIDSKVIEAAIVEGRYELPFNSDNNYSGFIDTSGGRSDSFTLAIAYRESKSKKIILSVAREVRPPFRPAVVVEEFSELFKDFNINEVEADAYAGEWVSSNFSEYGIKVINSKKSKSEIYKEILPLLNNGQIELLDNARLINQFKALERKIRPSGREQIDVFWGHDDLVNAAAGACMMATKKKEGVHIAFSKHDVY